MKKTETKYQCVPFWSWNDELDEKKLCEQIEWMHRQGVGGFFMHARGGLKTEYLGEKWFSCVEACEKKAKELGMEAYAYDENGWPSGFAGGKLLEDIENHDRYLTFTLGEWDEKALVSYDMTGEKLVRATGGKNCLNIFEHYSASTADILNPEVVDKFIALTHAEYKKRDRYGLKGFFTDEPQYYRWGTPYTKMLAPRFRECYDEDILDGLGLLFVEKEGYRAFRYKYWKSMQALMLKNYSEKIYRWCDENGYKLTGHYVEETSFAGQIVCCGGVMPFYEYEHIPGIDWLGRSIGNELSPKQVGSVAAQLGKKQVISEMFACAGWDVTPKELKRIAEFMYVNGVNLMCQHLLPYAEHGQRKRDYPAHFSAVNPWVEKNFKQFNDYFSVLGKLLSESEEIVNVAVLSPLRSAYFDFKRADAPFFGVREIEDSFASLIEKLGRMQIPHHYIDETILNRHGRAEGKKIIVGKCAYEYLILPKTYTMDETTEKILREFAANGGKILLADGKPGYLEGEVYSYDYLKSTTSWEEILSSSDYRGAESENIRTTYRTDGEGRKFIYAVNLGKETDWRAEVSGFSSFEIYDILSDTLSPCGRELHFDEGQSYILYCSDKQPQRKKSLRPLPLGDTFAAEPVENYLTLDFVRYSFDGKTYGEKLHHMGVFDEMLKKRYSGELYLKYEFDVEEVPSDGELLVENTNLISVSLNGKELERKGSSSLEKELFVYDASGAVKGRNEIVVRIDYRQSEDVYYALFGENVTESLKNCLAYDTDIEAVYLKGKFGVYGDFRKGNGEDILIGENFRVGVQKHEITRLITDGYPFFSGEISLKQTVFVEDTDRELVLGGRFHCADVKVNGRFAGRMMFSDKLDLSDVLKKGENEIEILLTVGNRNLLGPFHTPVQEDLSVGPHTFERTGTWKDGKSSILRESYSFVKTVI